MTVFKSFFVTKQTQMLTISGNTDDEMISDACDEVIVSTL